MELRFAAKARESVVLAQALGAAVATSVEFLTRCLTERAGPVLQQVARIGLLLHSVCLLSTSGREAHMLDDFAGAYEHMDLVRRAHTHTWLEARGETHPRILHNGVFGLFILYV